jgi:hypothetical protein
MQAKNNLLRTILEVVLVVMLITLVKSYLTLKDNTNKYVEVVTEHREFVVKEIDCIFTKFDYCSSNSEAQGREFKRRYDEALDRLK